MTPFNPGNKDVLTYGECLKPAMKIKEQDDADQYFAQYATYIQRSLKKEPRKDGMTAEEIAKINIGYFAGYYDSETMRRVNELFKTRHPVFGKIVPMATEALQAGMTLAKQ